MEKFKTEYLPKIKQFAKYVSSTWLFKCFLIAFALEIVLECLGRRSFFGGIVFFFKSPFVFLYNVSIIFFTLLFALFLRKRVFGLCIISVLWLTCGIVNFIVLGYRVTPFAAIDFLMIEDVLSMIDVYFKKWQLMLLVAAVVLVVAVLVILFLKTPRFEGDRKVKTTMVICIAMWMLINLSTKFGVKYNIISDDFANLGMAYSEYGFAYCFTNSIIDNGISKPGDYSSDTMNDIKKDLDTLKYEDEKKTPNVIVIQLESFFDITPVEGLVLSENPIPTFTRLKEEYPSGYFWVPALGAGTANSEFEVLTGIKSSFFGAGEYPYKTTINETPAESLCSIFDREGYGTYAIHNNKGSFYSRFDVYDTLGFDAFISLEYMYGVTHTSTGWAKDKTLVDDIMKCLADTDHQDFVFTISVQGHGKYPDEFDACEDHIQVEYENKDVENRFHYYVNQIYEMDLMIQDLVERLDKLGEEYVLVLYGDHLPTLDITEEQLKNSTMFQTEYILVNNIGIEMEDEDIYSYQLSTKLLSALGIEPGYAQKIQTYYEDEEEMKEKLELLAYDMMFGNLYIYDGESPVTESDMRYGVDEIRITEVKDVEEQLIVTGENFNKFSVVYEDDESLSTVYVDRNTLLVPDSVANDGSIYVVKQVDESHHEKSQTAEYIYSREQ